MFKAIWCDTTIIDQATEEKNTKATILFGIVVSTAVELTEYIFFYNTATFLIIIKE